jgi:hypothetical protein
VARVRSGRWQASRLQKLRSVAGLHASRAMVELIARLPGSTNVEFTPAPGR